MTNTDLNKAISIIKTIKNTPKGQFLTVNTERVCSTKKTTGGKTFIKRGSFTIQNGIEYANRQVIKDAVESGNREAPTMPKWAERTVIENVVFWSNRKTGELYLPFNIISVNASEYVQDGKIVNPLDIEGIYAKDLPKKKSDAKKEVDRLEEKVGVLKEKVTALFIAPKLATVASIGQPFEKTV